MSAQYLISTSRTAWRSAAYIAGSGGRPMTPAGTKGSQPTGCASLLSDPLTSTQHPAGGSDEALSAILSPSRGFWMNPLTRRQSGSRLSLGVRPRSWSRLMRRSIAAGRQPQRVSLTSGRWAAAVSPAVARPSRRRSRRCANQTAANMIAMTSTKPAMDAQGRSISPDWRLL